MKYFNNILMIVILMVLNATVALAQAPPPSSNPPGAPIDGMVGLLLAAGVGYGVKRFKEKTRR